MSKSIIVQASGCHYDECRGANNLSLFLQFFVQNFRSFERRDKTRERRKEEIPSQETQFQTNR